MENLEEAITILQKMMTMVDTGPTLAVDHMEFLREGHSSRKEF